MAMVSELGPELAAALIDHARRQGVVPESLALDALRKQFLPTALPFEPRDDWERELLSLATDCGVSLSDEALSRAESSD